MAKTSVPFGDQPAFPCDVPVERFEPGGETARRAQGLTVRDWLAAQALAGLLASEAGRDSVYSIEANTTELFLSPAIYARDAYALADAMLAAREAR